MTTVSAYHLGKLNAEQAQRIAVLISAVWPDSGETVEVIARSFLTNTGNQPGKKFYVIWKDDQAIACAQTFPRRIRYEGGETEIMALAGVCVDGAHRGRGLGSLIVRAAFGDVDDGRYRVALFQTGVPDFYRKLGATTVQNEFCDNTAANDGRSPWWDDYVMIYPEGAEWPNGRIDLNGAGY